MSTLISTAREFVTRDPRLKVSLPTTWVVRDRAFDEATVPRCLIFASTHALPMPAIGNGHWDAPVEDLPEDGLALELAAYDLRRSPKDWLTPPAIEALKAAGQWPWNIGAKVAASIGDGVSLVELANASYEGAERAHRAGAFRHREWIVSVDLWAGRSADVAEAETILSSIVPA